METSILDGYDGIPLINLKTDSVVDDKQQDGIQTGDDDNNNTEDDVCTNHPHIPSIAAAAVLGESDSMPKKD